MPIIRHEMQVHNQVDTLHVTSRNEMRKNIHPKEAKGTIGELILQSSILLLGVILGIVAVHNGSPGMLFFGVILLTITVADLFWLIPTIKAYRKRK